MQLPDTYQSRTKRHPKWTFAFLSFSFFLYCAATAHADLVQGAWQTNGNVWTTASANGVTYIGGTFDHLALVPTGGAAPLDINTGFPPITSANIQGRVSAVVADGNGGWYIGGDFTSVSGFSRNRIAHILSDGSLDMNWNPDANSSVLALALAGNTLYVGGDFTQIGGQARNQIAALDVTLNTNNATAWNPNAVGSDGCWISALALAGNTLYVGGYFIQIGGQGRNNIAALDTTLNTNNATAWDPGANSWIYSIVPVGNTIYVGGNFTQIGGLARQDIAALDANLNINNATPWNPTANGTVLALAVAGNTVYAGGYFNQIGGAGRNHIAALDTTLNTNNATAWNPDADWLVYSLAVAGNTVFAGGGFTQIGGQTRIYIAALDATLNSNNATSWTGDADAAVKALAVNGNTIYVGGNFTMVGMQPRKNIAALNAQTGVPTAWNPTVQGPDLNTYSSVWSLAVAGNIVYAGGDFTQAGGQVRNNIAALDATLNTNNATAWDPNANNRVRSLAVSNNTIYAGGDFTQIGGQARNKIAALNAILNTNNATAWNPNPPNSDDSIYALAVAGTTVYAGGHFAQIGGQPRNYIAALDATRDTNNATDWNPNADWSVSSLAVAGNLVYAAGRFNRIGGLVRSNIAALDTTVNTNNATAWDPNVEDTDGYLHSVAVAGNIVVVGGHFTRIGGQNRTNLAALDATINTNNATGFQPNPNDEVDGITINGGMLYVGGLFSIMGGVTHKGFAQFTLPLPLPTITAISPTFGPTAGGTNLTITGTNFVSGATVKINSNFATNVVFVNATTLTATTPAGTAGAKSVYVTNPDMNYATLTNGFNYTDNPAPTIASIAPAVGSTTGGTSVTITGTNFISGATVKIGGTSATNVVRVNATTLTATTPAGTVGPKNVLVTNPDTQFATLSNGFTYDLPPTISAVSPTSGSPAGGTPITITGTNFVSGATVKVDTNLATNVVFVNATTLTATTPAGTVGQKTVRVTNPDTLFGTLNNGFTYNSPPQISTIVPPSGDVEGGNVITITGAHYLAGVTVKIGGNFATNVVLTGDSRITATTPPGTAGNKDVVVTNPDGQSATRSNGFTYALPPTISSITPAGGPTAGGTQVNVRGTNFDAGTRLIIGGNSVPVSLNTSSSFNAFTPAGTAGLKDVVVTNLGTHTGTLTNGFNYTDNPAPTVTAITPASGSTAGGINVTITGTNFVSGATVKIGANAATNVVVVSATSLTAKTPSGPAGTADIVVTNPDRLSGTLYSGYTYVVPPAVTGITPISGSINGGTNVTITGTGFVSGATVNIGVNAATNVVRVNATTLTATTPAGTAGPKNVVVTNPDGQTGTLNNGFTYTTNVPPTVTAINPASGSTAGGLSVTITGTNFVSGATVNIGVNAATNVVFVSATSLTATTPTGTAGAKNVMVTNPDTLSGTLTNGFTYIAPPIITQDPANKTVTVGLVATFSVGATGTPPLSYQWKKSTDGGNSWSNPTDGSGSTTSTYTTPPTVSGDSGNKYKCVVTNEGGDTPSQAATLTVSSHQAPTVTGVNPNSGPTAGSTAITITGTNFYGIPTVTIGGRQAANVLLVDDHTLQARTPTGNTGARDVVVVNPDSQSATLTGGFTYTGLPAPTITSITPNTGATSGNTFITINGSNFLASPSIQIGPNFATNIQFVNSSQITAFTPAGTLGTVDVRVLDTDGQTALAAGGFSYVPAPVVNSVAPNSGSTSGGTNITITGANFLPNPTVRVGGTLATGVTRVNSTTVNAVTPAGQAGSTYVSVTNTDGQNGVLPNAFTYTDVAPAPTVTSLTPASGSTLGGTAVTITGTNFVSGATVKIGVNAATNVVFVSVTKLTANTPAGTAGAKNVVVTNPDTQFGTLTNGFTYNPAPTILGLSPGEGSSSGGYNISIQGSNFVSGATVKIGGTLSPQVLFVNAGMLTVAVPAGTAGKADVVVTNPDLQSATFTNGFTYLDPPSITQQPSAKSVVVGNTATFSVTASGSPTISYRWQKKANGDTSFTNIPAATSSVYTTPVTTLADNGTQFQCVVTNSVQPAATSDAVVLTVTESPVAPSVKQQPVSQTVAVGQPVSFSITATGTDPLAYQWQQVANGVWKDIPGAQQPTYTIAAVTALDNGDQFRCEVTNSVDVDAAVSSVVTLTVTGTGGGAPPPPSGQVGTSVVKAYPNPARDSVTFSAPPGSSISVFDTAGHKIYGTTVDDSGLAPWNFAGDNLASGLYPTIVKAPDGAITKSALGVVR